MMRKYSNCQSCGIPFKKGSDIMGTEVDGNKSLKYCISCYLNGKFTQPNMTLNKMLEIVKERIKKMGLPRILDVFFTSGIPKLERWKSKKNK